METNEIFIKSAKTIIEQNGDCNHIQVILCKNCPANEKGDYETYCKKIEWFKNWLKENEETKMEKVQMTEEEFDDKFSFGKVFAMVNKKFDPNNESINQQCYLTYEVLKELFKDEGYIKKSELETLVDEWDVLKVTSLKNRAELFYVTRIERAEQLIQALKKSHPEFKK